MREVFIGDLIREKRKELKLSQADLSFGICDISTLSRIENKHQTPTRNVLNALLERLGVSSERFYAAVTAEEMRINELYIEITNDNVEYGKSTGENKEKVKRNLLRKHDELRQIMDEDDNISKQMLARSQVIISDWSIEEKIEKLTWAIRLTQPSFKLQDIKTGLFYFDEIKLINLMAVTYSEGGKSEKAIEIWQNLLRNSDNRFDGISGAKAEKDLILYGLAREMLIVKDYKSALQYAEEGQKLAVRFGIFLHLPGYIIIRAECEYQLGDYDKSKRTFEQAYSLCEIIGDNSNKELIKDGYMEYFNQLLS